VDEMYDVAERLGLLGQLRDYPGERLAYRYPEVGANPAAVGKELGTVPLSVSGPTELYAADWQMPK
jgi:hypothetical protein